MDTCIHKRHQQGPALPNPTGLAALKNRLPTPWIDYEKLGCTCFQVERYTFDVKEATNIKRVLTVTVRLLRKFEVKLTMLKKVPRKRPNDVTIATINVRMLSDDIKPATTLDAF